MSRAFSTFFNILRLLSKWDLHNFNYVNNPPNNDDRDCFYINCLLSLLLLM